MNVLLVAGADRQALLEDAIRDDFEYEKAVDVTSALKSMAERDFDGLLLHFDIGSGPALELLGQLKRGANGQLPGIVVIAREIDTPSVVELMRAGAVDVLLETSMKPREIPHALRNAAFCAQASARLYNRRSAPTSKQVLVVGSGDAVEAIVLMLEASGLEVRHETRTPEPRGGKDAPRAIVVDLSVAGDGEALLRLLKPG